MYTSKCDDELTPLLQQVQKCLQVSYRINFGTQPIIPCSNKHKKAQLPLIISVNLTFKLKTNSQCAFQSPRRLSDRLVDVLYRVRVCRVDTVSFLTLCAFHREQKQRADRLQPFHTT